MNSYLGIWRVVTLFWCGCHCRCCPIHAQQSTLNPTGTKQRTQTTASRVVEGLADGSSWFLLPVAGVTRDAAR